MSFFCRLLSFSADVFSRFPSTIFFHALDLGGKMVYNIYKYTNIPKSQRR